MENAQNRINVNANTFETDLSCTFRFETMHVRQSPVKTTMTGDWNNSKDF